VSEHTTEAERTYLAKQRVCDCVDYYGSEAGHPADCPHTILLKLLAERDAQAKRIAELEERLRWRKTSEDPPGLSMRGVEAARRVRINVHPTGSQDFMWHRELLTAERCQREGWDVWRNLGPEPGPEAPKEGQ
jgi:hypothetical protein